MSVLDSQPAGHLVAGGTMGTGLATWLNLIPNEIGKLATLVGIILSVVLIIMHTRKIRQDARESSLREALLQEQLKREKASNSASEAMRRID